MPAWTRLIGGWVLALVVALALSWGAVSMVRGSVIEASGTVPRSVAVPADTTDQAVPSSSIGNRPDETGALLDSTSTTQLAATSVTSSSPGTGATSSTTSTTVARSATTSSTSSTSTTSTSVSQGLTTKTYQLTGGSVTISYSPGVVHFKAAVPQSGYSTDVEEDGPDRVRVEFEKDETHSKFRAEWADGKLVITIDE